MTPTSVASSSTSATCREGCPLCDAREFRVCAAQSSGYTPCSRDKTEEAVVLGTLEKIAEQLAESVLLTVGIATAPRSRSTPASG